MPKDCFHRSGAALLALLSADATLPEVLRGGVAVSFDSNLRHEIAERIRRACPQAIDILVFGSRARGDARDDSDVDLVLLIPEGMDPSEAAIAAHRGLRGVDLAFDVVALTPADWRRIQQSRGWYEREMAREAVRLDEAA